MDPISLAIISAIAAGATTALAEKAVSDGYNKLKDLIKRKFGADSKLVKTIADAEDEPEAIDSHKPLLEKRVTDAKAHEDADLIKAAEELLNQLKQQPGGQATIQQIATGSYIAQASHGSSASVNIGQPPQDKK
jgi:hypothetical protein